MEIAAAILQDLPGTERAGTWLAAQCCEYLNRALILKRIPPVPTGTSR